MQTYYTARTVELLRDFDASIKRVRGLFVARYGDMLTEHFVYLRRIPMADALVKVACEVTVEKQNTE